MRDLIGRCKQYNVHLLFGESTDSRLQRARVLGQFPIVDLDGHDGRTASLQAGDQAGVRYAVFLNSDNLAGDRNVGIDRLQQLTPGVGLGGTMGRRNAEFLENDDRLGSANDGRRIGQGRDETFPINVSLDGFDELSCSDSGQQNHDVDLGRDQLVGKVDHRAVRFQRHFTHRGAHVGNATVPFDQLFDLAGTPALESGDMKSVEV